MVSGSSAQAGFNLPIVSSCRAMDSFILCLSHALFLGHLCTEKKWSVERQGSALHWLIASSKTRTCCFKGAGVLILSLGLNCSHEYKCLWKSYGRCNMAFLVALEWVLPVATFPWHDSQQMQGKCFNKQWKACCKWYSNTVVQGISVIKRSLLEYLWQFQEFSRRFPVQEEVMGLGHKKPDNLLKESTEERMEESVGSVNGG